ncbi:Macrophage mannose receptor 1, partial [Acropora cervicornis]
GLLALLLKLLDCSASYIGAYIPEDCNNTRLMLITNETINSFNIPFKTSLRKDNSSLSNELLLQGNETTWCFNNSASYLEINFTEQYEICAVETKGILGLNNDTLLLSSYVLEAFVFEGNTPEDPFTKRKNYVINANLTASVIRIWPLLSNGSCTQFKLYVASNGAARAQIQTYILEVRNRSSTSLFIRWAPPVNVSVDGYKIKLIYSDNGEQLFDVDGPFTDLIASRLYRHSKYCVTVSVIIGETVGSESDPPLCAFTAIDVPSDAPENLTFSQVTNSSLVLGWDHKRSYFNSTAVVGFALKVKHSNVLIKNLTVPALPEEKHISGLNKSTRYCMTVTAILEQGGTGLESETGQLNMWSSWGVCSASCGGGQQQRTRAHGNEGIAENRSCNTQSCFETCLKSGADLASISSLAENDFIKSLSKESLWIGLNSLENELVYNWSDGTPSTFSFWFPREPNYLSQKCVKFYIGDGKWLDEYCSGRNFYVCKMK